MLSRKELKIDCYIINITEFPSDDSWVDPNQAQREHHESK